MRTYFRACSVVACIVVASVSGYAQDPPATQGGLSIPLRVELVISRYQGDKKVSSVPFTLSVVAGRLGEPSSRLRMGVQVPFLSTPITPEAKQAVATGQASPLQYRDVGTNIDCSAMTLDQGRFKVSVTIEESSVYSDQDKSKITTAASPVFRQFRVTNVLVLKDGQSQEFSTATDKITGEVVKMDVTLSVVK